MKNKSLTLIKSLCLLSIMVAPIALIQVDAGYAETTAPTKTAEKKAEKKAMIDHKVKNIDGEEVDLASYRGKALMIVNTASYCGYTKQYADLKKLQDQYAKQGFTVLAFPCNDFGGQEPGSPKEIKTFCEGRFEVNFPLFDKVHAKGPNKSPLYKTLTEETPEGIKGEIRWNFTKFLVNKAGQVVKRFESGVNPNDPTVHKAIKGLITE